MNLFCACAIWRLCIVLNGWVSISNYVKVQTPKYLTFSFVVVKPLLPLDRPWSIKVIQVEHPYPSRRFPPFKRCIARQAWTISQWAGNKRLHYLRKKRLIAWFPVLEKRHDSHPGIHYCPALLLHGTYRYVRYTFSSNHNIHKSSYGLYFWPLNPLLDRFYYYLSIKGSGAQKQSPHELLWTLWFDKKVILIYVVQ